MKRSPDTTTPASFRAARAAGKVLTFVRTWTLPISMLAGIAAYFLFISIPGHQAVTPQVNALVAILQPLFIFMMLFLTFCKVKISDLKLEKWHFQLVAIQAVAFAAIALLSVRISNPDWRAVAESACLCLICPTATAAAVVTGKLGGNTASVVSYTVLINIVTAVMVPVIVPFCHPQAGMGFLASLGLILAKVFPLLILPMVAASIVRRWMPRLLAWVLRHPDLAFYLWAISLSLAIAVTVKSIVHSHTAVWCEAAIAAVSLVSCILQFAIGKHVGSLHGLRTTAGQAMGQKNTVFAIWMGFTFLTPVTAVAGGFYSVWHNVINSWQLYKAQKAEAKK